MFSWSMNVCHSVSCAFKPLNTYTHLTQHLSLCRARRWAQRHTGTSSRIPLLSAVHQHTYTHMARSHGHGVHASLSAMPPAHFGFVCNTGYYTSGGVDWIEMILLVGTMTFYRRQADTHTRQFQDSGKTDIPNTQESWTYFSCFALHVGLYLQYMRFSWYNNSLRKYHGFMVSQ